MSRRITYGRSNAYDLQYHVIFITKYRKPVLIEEIRAELINSFNKTSKNEEYKIILANGEPDHIHLLIEATPKLNITEHSRTNQRTHSKTRKENKVKQ